MRRQYARVFNHLEEIAHYLGVLCLFSRQGEYILYAVLRGFPPFFSLAHPLQYCKYPGAIASGPY